MLKILTDSLRVLCSFLFCGLDAHWQLTNQLVELQSQEIGKKIVCKTADISSAQCFRINGDIMWSGSQALLVLSVESRCIPDTVIVTLGIDDIGSLELSVGGICEIFVSKN